MSHRHHAESLALVDRLLKYGVNGTLLLMLVLLGWGLLALLTAVFGLG